MNGDLFQGDLVRLVAIDEDLIPDSFSRWSRDSYFWRLADTRPAYPKSVKSQKDVLEKEMEKGSSNLFWFMIRTLDDDRFVGDISLDGVNWSHGESFIGIEIGGRDNWDRGYGTDAMRVALRYAFEELNLYRVSLNVFGYNPRAIRIYEKVGFQHEGVQRQVLNRAGRRWDISYMGILQAEWLELSKSR
jgi:RimJ/RimL family protein N-acetyltransferase